MLGPGTSPLVLAIARFAGWDVLSDRVALSRRRRGGVAAGATGAEWVCGRLESVATSGWRAVVVRVLCLCRRVLFVMIVVSCALVFCSSLAY